MEKMIQQVSEQLSALPEKDLITLRNRLIEELMSSPKLDDNAKKEIKKMVRGMLQAIAESVGLELRFNEASSGEL